MEATIEKVGPVSREIYARVHPEEYVYFDVIGVHSGLILGRYRGYAANLLPDDGEWFGYPKSFDKTHVGSLRGI